MPSAQSRALSGSYNGLRIHKQVNEGETNERSADQTPCRHYFCYVYIVTCGVKDDVVTRIEMEMFQ